MTLDTLKDHTRKFITDFPESKSEFVEFYELAISEIEEGGSERHECELAYNDMLEIANQILVHKKD